MATAFAPGSTRRSRVRASFSPSEWRRLYGMFGFIAFLHVVGWTLLILASTHHYGVGTKGVLGVGTGVLAYSLGMRHAFDAEHAFGTHAVVVRRREDEQRPADDMKERDEAKHAVEATPFTGRERGANSTASGRAGREGGGHDLTLIGTYPINNLLLRGALHP